MSQTEVIARTVGGNWLWSNRRAAKFRRYEQPAVSRRDLFFRHFDPPVEDRWPHRQPRFWFALPHSMDRLGAGAEEHQSVRILGMQRNREPADAELLCVLSARLRRCAHDRD